MASLVLLASRDKRRFVSYINKVQLLAHPHIMKILSLFDGISCARVALEKSGIPVKSYFASEIDKYAISISQKNYSDIIQVGSVVDFHPTPLWRDTILLIGGSPCQDLSIAKKNRQGLDGARSGLFWAYVRILNEIKPKYFILENVASMPKEAKQIITEALGVQPIMINAALVSAQNRKRLFWVGKWNGKKYEQVIIPQPEDRNILLKDILEKKVDSKYNVQGVALRNRGQGKKPEYNGTEKANAMTTVQTDSMIRIGQIGKGGQGDRIYSPEGKSVNLSANGGGRGAKTGLYLDNAQVRKLTPIECERLQSLPDNYTEGVSNTQRYKALGNAFNVDVIVHILKHIWL